MATRAGLAAVASAVASGDESPTRATDGVVDQPIALTHEPALDGLRGVAVAVVVLFHLGRLQGGFLGVDLFFVLSGFLITSLLVTEHRRRGAVDLARFWARRARRLLPALFLMLAGVGLLMLRLTPSGRRAELRGDAVATLGYVANWHRMADPLGYWDMFSQPSPFDHTWSLAIEEQFYLVWPVVAVVVLGRRWGRAAVLGLVATAGGLLSLLLLATTYAGTDTNRAYFGTDSRLGPTLLGAALALATVDRPPRDAPPSRAIEAAGVAAAAWMLVSLVAVDGVGPWYYRGGLASFAAAAVVVVTVVTRGPPGQLASLLSWSPLRALGIISYGVYLWHWPVIVFVTPDRAAVRGWLLDLVRVTITLLVATVSFVAVERPIRRGVLRLPRMRLLATGAAVAAALTVVLATAGSPEHTDPAAALAVGDGDLRGVSTEYLHVPAAPPAGAPRVLLVGDSGASASGPAFAAEGEEAGIAVAFASDILCSPVYPSDVTRGRDGVVVDRDCPAGRRHDLWEAVVDQFDPDLVVYYLANAGGTSELQLDGRWVQDCDPAYDRYLRDALIDDFELLGQSGARLVLTTTPQSIMAESDLVGCRNATYHEVASRRPEIQVVDLNTWVTEQVETSDTEVFRDTIHLSSETSRLAAAWLFAELCVEPAPEDGCVHPSSGASSPGSA